MNKYTNRNWRQWTPRRILLISTFALMSSLAFAPAAQAATIMRLGSSGSSVTSLQSELARLGYSVGTLDGIYGPKTLAAVEAFQQHDHLQVDGIVGPLTESALEKDQISLTPNIRSNKISGIISEANKLIGTPYVWGGTTPAGFDCSGFTQYVYASQGIELPRISQNQAAIGSSVSYNNLEPGDLVFFSFAANGTIDHVGIYLGNSQFISATTHKGVAVYPISSAYWLKAYKGARRIL